MECHSRVHVTRDVMAESILNPSCDAVRRTGPPRISFSSSLRRERKVTPDKDLLILPRARKAGVIGRRGRGSTQKSACLCLPSAGIKGVRLSLFSCWVLEPPGAQSHLEVQPLSHPPAFPFSSLSSWGTQELLQPGAHVLNVRSP